MNIGDPEPTRVDLLKDLWRFGASFKINDFWYLREAVMPLKTDYFLRPGSQKRRFFTRRIHGSKDMDVCGI